MLGWYNYSFQLSSISKCFFHPNFKNLHFWNFKIVIGWYIYSFILSSRSKCFFIRISIIHDIILRIYVEYIFFKLGVVQNSSDDEIFRHVRLLLKLHVLKFFLPLMNISHNLKEIESTRSLIQESFLLGTHAVIVRRDLPWYEEIVQFLK